MSKIFFFFTLICGLCFTSAEAFAKNFVSGFVFFTEELMNTSVDFPLMEGLKQIESDDIAFGNEETRYLEAQLVAVRKKNFADIQKFYRETLPQLGWTEQAGSATFLQFSRENDILEINQVETTPLKISISLKNKS